MPAGLDRSGSQKPKFPKHCIQKDPKGPKGLKKATLGLLKWLSLCPRLALQVASQAEEWDVRWREDEAWPVQGSDLLHGLSCLQPRQVKRSQKNLKEFKRKIQKDIKLKLNNFFFLFFLNNLK